MGNRSSMDNLTAVRPPLSECDDCLGGSCHCKVAENSIMLISIISSVACLIDLFAIHKEKYLPSCNMKEHVENMRVVLVTLFQVANVCLLLAVLLESSSLVNVYVCFTLGFVPMALVLAIIEFLTRVRREGIAQAFLSFIPEVAFIFVISRCLPMVNAYRKHLFSIRK